MTDKNPAGGLVDLIERHRAGRNYEELATNSRGLLKAPAIRNLVNGGLSRFPRPDSIRGYSYALGVPLVDVVIAAAISTGLKPHELGAGSGDDLVIAKAGALPEESRRLLRDTAAMMLWWQDKVEGGDSETPELTPEQLMLAAEDAPDESAAERERARLDERGEEDQSSPDDDDHVA